MGLEEILLVRGGGRKFAWWGPRIPFQSNHKFDSNLSFYAFLLVNFNQSKVGLEEFLLVRGGGHGGGRIFVANHFSNFHQIYNFIGQNGPIKSGP